MDITITFICLLSFCLAVCISRLATAIQDEEGARKIIPWLGTLLLCIGSLTLNIISLCNDIKHPRLEFKEFPQIDTLITTINSVSDTTYVLDLSEKP